MADKKNRKNIVQINPDDLIDLTGLRARIDAEERQRAPAPMPEEPSMLRSLGDSGIAAGTGLVTGVKLISDAFGADNAVSRTLGEANQGMQGLLSPYRQAELQNRARLIREAEQSGSTAQEIGAYLGGAMEAPLDTLLNVAGTAAPTMASMLIPGAREANVARLLGVGTGAIQGAGAGKSAIYDAVLQQKLQEGVPEAEARAIADAAQAYGGDNTDTILANTALGAVAGGSGLESAARALKYGKAAQAAPGLVRRVGTGAVVEGLPEAGQGGMEQASANIALQREGYDVPTMRGVAGSAALEGVAGGALGGAFAIPSPSEPAADVPPAPIVPVTGPLTKAVNAGAGPVANAASQANANALAEMDKLAQEDGGAEQAPAAPADPLKAYRATPQPTPEQAAQAEQALAAEADQNELAGMESAGRSPQPGNLAGLDAAPSQSPAAPAFASLDEADDYVTAQQKLNGSTFGVPIQNEDGSIGMVPKSDPRYVQAVKDRLARKKAAKEKANVDPASVAGAGVADGTGVQGNPGVAGEPAIDAGNRPADAGQPVVDPEQRGDAVQPGRDERADALTPSMVAATKPQPTTTGPAPITAQPAGTRGTTAADVIKPTPKAEAATQPVEKAAAPAPEMVRVRDVYGQDHWVRRDELDSDKTLLRRHQANGTPLKENTRVHRQNLDPSGEKAAEAWKDLPIFDNGGKGFKSRKALDLSIKRARQDPARYDIQERNGLFFAAIKPTDAQAAPEGTGTQAPQAPADEAPAATGGDADRAGQQPVDAGAGSAPVEADGVTAKIERAKRRLRENRNKQATTGVREELTKLKAQEQDIEREIRSLRQQAVADEPAPAPAPATAPTKGLGAQLAELNAELERQGPVQNANTRAKRDAIRKQIAEQDFPDILRAVDDDLATAEELNAAFKYAGDEPKAKTIARIFKKRGITDEYAKRWTERLLGADDGQADDTMDDPEMAAYEGGKTGKTRAQDKAKVAEDAAKAKAQADLDAALGDLGDIFGKNTRLMMMPEQEQKLLPVLTRVLDAAFRLGYYKFKDAARFALQTIRAKLGAEVADQLTLDHLQGAYIGMAGKYQDKGADTKRAVIDVESLAELEEAPAPAPAPTPAPPKSDDPRPSLDGAEGRNAVAQAVADRLVGGEPFATIVDARKFVAELTGQKVEPGTRAAKMADEAVEMGVALAARDIVRGARKQGRSDEVIYKRLVALYEAQPSLNVRDSDSIRNQAYSTPAPLAFVASRLAQIQAGQKVGEPTAGNGMLVMEVAPENAALNELNQDRAANLEAMGFERVRLLNAATNVLAPAKSLDAVVMNPPFGAVRDEDGETIKYEVLPNYTTGEVDHAIVFKALEAMKDDGNAVLIIGGTLAESAEGRKDAYRGKAKREFFYNLHQQYNVVDHFTVGGDLYKKQGTTYPVDVIVIRGRGKASRALPAADLPPIIETWAQLQEKLNAEFGGVGARGPGSDRGNRSEAGEPADTGRLPAPSGVPGSADGDGGRAGRAGAGGKPADGGGSAGRADGRPGAGGSDAGVGERPGADAPAGTGDSGRAGDGASNPSQQPGSRGSAQGDDAANVGDRTGGKSDRARLSDEDTGKLQVRYTNFSKNKSVGTLVPTSHLSALQNAFDNLRKRVGDIDDYVRGRLQYDEAGFQKAFSAEQVEALALAIDNIERGKGFIIGDQTGIGKGRVVAAMIRFAKLSGKTPVFVTQMPDLYGDMMRDLNDIGMAGFKPLMTNNNASVPLDAEALAWFGEVQAIKSRVDELSAEIERLVGDEAGKPLSSDELKSEVKKAMKATTNPEIISLRDEIKELEASKPAKRGQFLDTPAIEKHEAELARLVSERSIGDYGAIFTTYNQMAALDSGAPKTGKDGQKKPASTPTFAYRDTFLKAMVNQNAMLILDESHNAGEKGDGKFPKVGDTVRHLVNAAGSVFYSSATFAKNPAVMDVYGRTDLGLVLNSSAGQGALNSIPQQQVASAMLVEAGQYIRRERSFDGIEYKIETVEGDTQAAEDVSTAMRLVVEFDQAKKSALADIQNDMDAEGAVIAATGGGMSEASVSSTNFTGVMHNVVNTFLLALKADAAADAAIEAIKRGEKPVLTVANTMEMFITDYAKEAGLGIGSELNATFADVLMRYLEKTRMARIKHANGDVEVVRLSDRELGPEGVQAYESAQEFIKQMDLNIPLSPIDHIKERIAEAGFSIGEVTGRQTVVERGIIRPRNKAEMNTAGKKNTIAKFNGGQLDALIINRSGSTGLSMHASETFPDQRRRVMVVAQAELDINNHMQMLGRTNRTGQVTKAPPKERRRSFASTARQFQERKGRLAALEKAARGKAGGAAARALEMAKAGADIFADEDGDAATYGLPRYVQLTANVPIEQRPAAVLAAKMAGLSANTTAGRKSAVEDSSAPDFMNKYGDEVAAMVVGGDPELNQRLGFPVKLDDSGVPNSMGAAARVTGRIGLLTLREQTAIYDRINTEYRELIAQLDAMGKNDLEAKTYPLDAKELEKQSVVEGDFSSPFSAPVVAEKVEVRKLGKPFSSDKVRALVAESLGDKTTEQWHRQTIEQFKKDYNDEVTALRLAANSHKDPVGANVTLTKRLPAMKDAATRFLTVVPRLGEPVVIKTEQGNIYGVPFAFERKKGAKSVTALSSWQVSYAVVDGSRVMRFPLTQVFAKDGESKSDSAVVVQPASTTNVVTADRTGFDEVPVIDAFDRGQGDSREVRTIMTGNVLRASGMFPGRIISYTTSDGSIRQGLLTPATFDLKAAQAKMTPELTDPAQIVAFLEAGGRVVDRETGGELLWARKTHRFEISTSKTGKGKKIATDAGIYMVSSGARMRANLWPNPDTPAELQAFFRKVLTTVGVPLTTSTDTKDRLPAKFSRASTGKGVPMRDAQAAVGLLRREMPNAPDIVVLENLGQAPEGLQNDVRSAGAEFDWEAAYYEGRIYVMPDHIADMDRFMFVVGRHEVRHAGFDAILGDQADAVLLSIGRANRRVMREAKQKMADGLATSEVEAIEEALADMPVEDVAALTRIKVLVAAIRRWLRATAFKLRKAGWRVLADSIEPKTWTDNDVIAFVFKAEGVSRGPGGGSRFSRDNNQPFYSELRKQIAGASMNAAPAKGWSDTLKGMVQKGQVKQDEIEWTGLGDWLPMQTGKVSKQQVLEFLAANGVQVQEVALGTSDTSGERETLKRYGLTVEVNPEDPGMVGFFNSDMDIMTADEVRMEFGDEAGAAARRIEGVMLGNESNPKYATYQLPGGQNYREVLLTLPVSQAKLDEQRARRNEALNTFPRTPEAQRVLDETRDGGVPSYRSSHWDQPNVLAHIRVNDRVDADGKRVLFVEEIQSDWGQQGKKQGFGDPANRFSVKDAQGNIRGDFATAEEADAYLRNPPENMRAYFEQRMGGVAPRVVETSAGTGIPAAPFVTKTDAWLSLALKRIIKMAADGGYDRVAFITGEQSAERYDLSKSVASVRWENTAGDTVKLTVTDYSNRNIIDREMPSTKVDDYIGKELGDKIRGAIADGRYSGGFSGDGLKVGGEGMKAFYDRIVPNTLKDVLRKVGGGALETVDIGDGVTSIGMVKMYTRRPATESEAAEHIDLTGSDEGLYIESDGKIIPVDDAVNFYPDQYDEGSVGDSYINAIINRGYGSKFYIERENAPMPQPGFTVTPAMREKAAGGMPLFSRAKVVTNDEGHPEFQYGDTKLAFPTDSVRMEVIPSEGQRVMSYAIMPAEGFDVLGHVELLLENGRPVSLLDIVAYEQGKGAGRKAVEALLRAIPGDLNISNIVPEAQGFWERMGVPVQNLEEGAAYDGTLNLETYLQAQDGEGSQGDPRRAGGQGKGTDAGAKAGAPGAVQGRQVSARFSRRNSLATLREAGARKAEAVRDANLFAGYKVGDFMQSTGRLSWWDKSIGTPFNLAKRYPGTFGRVFNAVQDFLNDVSFYGTEAANLAPTLLPKLDKLRDITKSAISAADNRAISAPIFDGTLNWTRDKKGRPIRMEQAEAEAAKLTVDEKARELLRSDLLAPGVLKMWQGLPLDQYEANVESRYASQLLRPGIVFTPDELRSIFKLTQAQAGLYKEFRASVDRSLDDLTVSEITRLVRNEWPGAVQGEGQSAEDFAEEVRQALMDMESRDTADKVAAMANRLTDLKAKGYAPLSRFGHFTLDVVDADGERVYFGLFESQSEANMKARQMREQFPQATVTQGTQSQEAYKMLAGVSPETIELFGEILGLDATGDKESDKAFQEYLKKAKSTRSAMKRLIHRKGIAGFSEDSGRVLAGFITSNARRTSSNHHLKGIMDAVDAMPREQGELKDYAARMAEYVNSPVEEAQALRGLMFAQYLGGSVASALVNMTQPIAVTLPFLSQHTTAAKAAKLVTGAMADMASRKKLETGLENALKLAEEKGIVAPQEIHYLQAKASGSGALVSGDGTKAGEAWAKAKNGWSRLSFGWGKLFGFAELVNRRATFIASYRLAVQNKYPDPFKFASDAVEETQFVYNKGNRPEWARGAIGATLFTFKTYSISYVELLSRMWKLGGPEGKKALALALATMILMSGVDELPFMEDIEDVIDGVAQRVFGLNWQTKAKRNEWAAEVLGKDLAAFLARGVSGVPGVPMDVSGRLGMGNLLPGTGLFRKDSQDPARDVAEIAGPVGDLLKRGFTAAGMAAQGDLTKAALEVSPVAIRNVAKAADMADSGIYTDSGGKKVIETTAGEAILKGIGFQPNAVAKVQDASVTKARMIGLNKKVEAEIADLWAQGRFENDPAKVDDARNRLKDWNRQNPDSPIRIQQGQIQKRVKAMRMSKAERIAKTAPKEIRADVRRDLAEVNQ
jgi:hypothetical protein